MRTPFFGPANRSRSKNFADARLVNLYPEIMEDANARKAVGAFYSAPGRRLITTLGAGPIRGLHVTKNILYVVSGNQVYSVRTDLTAALLGTLLTSSGPVSIIDNGVQTAFFDGNTQTNTLSASIANRGSGGTNGTYILPLPAPGPGGVQATGLFTVSGGSITDVTLSNPGSGYASGSVITNSQLAALSAGLTSASITLTSEGGAGYIVSHQFAVTSVALGSPGGSVGHSYAPGEVLTLDGGVFLTPATVTVVSTSVAAPNTSSPISGITLASGGTGYPFDRYVVSVAGTGGSGSGARFSVATDRSGATSSVVSVTLYAGGTGYLVGDTVGINFEGGTGCTVTVTQVSGSGIVTGGTGGTPGDVIVTGTTGTGTKFQLNGTINGSGALSQLRSVEVAGAYTANPTDITHEPVTGGGLVGASVSVVMSALSGTLSSGGSYLTKPDNPVPQAVSNGAGLGSTWVVRWGSATSGFSILGLPYPGATTAAYQDGFGLVNRSGTQQFYQSNVDDLATWDPLNFSSADAQPDNIIGLADVQREVWVIKKNTTEVWINGGLSGFAFQRLDGVFIEMGCAAPFSIAKAGTSLIWVGLSKEGSGVVVMTNGLQVTPISTHALQYALAQYPTLADGLAYCYQQEGHLFYVLTFPTANATWCYDVTASRMMGMPMWHERPYFSSGIFSRCLDNCHAQFNGDTWVGDYRNGNIYALDMDALTDNGQAKKWLRTWRALPEPVNAPVRFDSLEIDMQTGLDVPDGTDPLVVLRWSDDGGNKWSTEHFISAGKTGETARRVRFNRLGSTKRNAGLDRIFELSSTDAFGVALIGADLT